MSKQDEQCNKCAICSCKEMSQLSILTSKGGKIAACGSVDFACPSSVETTNKIENNWTLLDCDLECKAFQQCSIKRNISYCYQCNLYPCTKFKRLADEVKLNGINLKLNQKILEVMGEDYLLSASK